jgi:hypothetical protein
MTNGIKLRLLKGTTLTPELKQALERLIPEYQVENYAPQADYQLSYQRRVESLYQAFLFILKSYPPRDSYPANVNPPAITTETLEVYAANCRSHCDLASKSEKALQDNLVKFTASLVNALALIWYHPKSSTPVDEAIACLNDAEQYLLMSKGRPSTATLIPMRLDNETKFVLQYDEALPSYTPELLADLQQIKKSKYTLTPLWFYKLPTYQQLYLHACNPTQVKSELIDFITLFTAIQASSPDWKTDLKNIEAGNAENLPEWFKKLSPALKDMTRELANEPDAFGDKLKKFRKDIDAISQIPNFSPFMEKIRDISLWYWLLPTRQQYFLAYVLENSTNLADAVSFVVSRHRTIPAPANYGAHSLYIIDSNGKTEQRYARRYRSSHVASRDCLDWPQQVQKSICQSNFNKVTEFVKPGQLVLMQTLISPIHLFDIMPDMITRSFDLPDLDLNKLARELKLQSHVGSTTFQHNHPYNLAKYLYYTTSNDRDSSKLIQGIKESPAGSKPSVQTLLKEYEAVLKSHPGTATVFDYDGRELFLSSLEDLLILEADGYSYGSCVSGKDRKTIQLIHTDAMILFKDKYGVWPQFGWPKDKLERMRFVDIVVDLYISRHHHELAGQNAPGSEGIKHASTYFPKDIVESINRRLNNTEALIHDDRLATNNEVKKITYDFSTKMLEEHRLISKLMAIQLGEDKCRGLYDALVLLISVKNQFTIPSSSYQLSFMSSKEDTPRGIQAIHDVLYNEASGKTNVERMENIFFSVLKRPEKGDNRRDATNSVYNRIRALFKPLPQDTTLNTLVENAVNEWTDLFNKSKAEQQTPELRATI